MAVRIRVQQSKVSDFSIPVYSRQTVPGTNKKLFTGVSNLSPVQLQALNTAVKAGTDIEKTFVCLPTQSQVFIVKGTQQ